MNLPWPMSMGTRIACHGQAAIRASLASTPREPLLFLYPAWARKSSTTAAIAHPRTEHSKPDHLLQATSSSFNNALGVDYAVSADASLKSSKAADSNPSALPERELVARISSQLPQQRAQNSRRIKSGDQRHAVRLPIETKIRRLLSRTQQARDEKQRKFTARHEWQARRDEELLRPGDPDWRVILETLVHSTPQHGKWLTEVIAVTASENSMLQLLNGLDDNIWSIANAYDCAVSLGPRHNTRAAHRTFTLSGSAVSISKTTAHILRILPDVQIHSSAKLARQKVEKGIAMSTDELDNGEVLPDYFRYVIAGGQQRNPLPPGQALPTLPSKWDSVSFYEYVYDLIHSDVPNHLHRFLYKNGDRHVSVVVEILHELFGDRDHKPFVTNMAIKEALRYFLKTNNIQEARALFNTHSIKDPELFNIMLQAPAQFNDLHNFHFILDLMLRRGFSPNRRTWIAFLNANSNNLQIRLSILSAMKEKGLLQHVPALREACEILAISELKLSLSKLQSQEQYLEQMDTRFGPDWLSLNTANLILHVLGSRGLISRCCEFLQVMDSRFVKLDSVSMNTILHHCDQSQNLEGAIEVMKLTSHYSNFKPDDETFRILFKMAWQTRSFNLARVIWRYACLSTAVTFKMRNLVSRSLRHDISHVSTLSTRNQFINLAGKFIIGQPMDSRDPQQKTGRLVASPASSVRASRQQDRVMVIVEKEMGIFRKWEAVIPFIEMLVKANEMDKAWKVRRSETAEKMDLMWMLNNGIQVPIRKREEAITADGDELREGNSPAFAH